MVACGRGEVRGRQRQTFDDGVVPRADGLVEGTEELERCVAVAVSDVEPRKVDKGFEGAAPGARVQRVLVEVRGGMSVTPRSGEVR
ncbi:hypothetical protein GCM10009780_55490 [Actinomadura alba]